MPYANAYNANIARALHGAAQKHINVENAINDNPAPIDITSQLAGITLNNLAVVGGKRFAASTVQDILGSSQLWVQLEQPSLKVPGDR